MPIIMKKKGPGLFFFSMLRGFMAKRCFEVLGAIDQDGCVGPQLSNFLCTAADGGCSFTAEKQSFAGMFGAAIISE